MRLGAWLGLLAFAALGCGTVGGAPWVRAQASGDRAYSAGRFDEATAAYAHAATVAERARDREESLYAAADAALRAGHVDDAIARFDAIAAAKAPGERSYRALYRASLLRLEHGARDRAYADLERMLREAPEHGQSRHALALLVERAEARGGKAGALDYLRKLYPPHANDQLGEEVLYAIAGREEALGAAREALEHYLALAGRYPYPTGALWDDALHHASLLHEALGEPRAAVDDLERMMAVHETSDLNGSYDRPRMPASALRIAELWRDRLDDHPRSKAAFARMISTFPKSWLVPRARFEWSQLHAADGERDAACRLARELIATAPETRWARRAAEPCPALAEEVARLPRHQREEKAQK